MENLQSQRKCSNFVGWKGENKTMNDSKLPKIAYIYIDESGTPTLEIEKNGLCLLRYIVLS